MPEVKFTDVKIGQVYVTHGGTVVVDKSGKTMGWGYDRVKVIRKNSTKLVVETPWGTSCILTNTYPLYLTREVEPRIEFKLITTYISKQEISFDGALERGICVEIIPPDELAAEQFLIDLIEYFGTPQSISAAAQKFGATYQKIRYSVDKIKNIGNHEVIRTDTDKGKTIHIIKVK